MKNWITCFSCWPCTSQITLERKSTPTLFHEFQLLRINFHTLSDTSFLNSPFFPPFATYLVLNRQRSLISGAAYKLVLIVCLQIIETKVSPALAANSAALCTTPTYCQLSSDLHHWRFGKGKYKAKRYRFSYSKLTLHCSPCFYWYI